MRSDLPPPDAAASPVAEEKPFLDHLEDLRRTMLRAVLAYGCVVLLCIPLTLKGYTVGLLKRPLMRATAGGAPATLPTLTPGGGFAVAMKVSLESAIVLSLPLLLYFIGGFVFPALTKRERGYFVPALACGAALFYAGMVFCYFTTLPWALQFFWNFNRLMGIDNLWTINEYISFVSRTLIAFGLVFEFPMVVLFLVKVGILSRRVLSQNRSYAIVLIFVLAAVLTPGPDAVTQCLMAAPLVLLYEACVVGARLMERRAGRRRAG